MCRSWRNLTWDQSILGLAPPVAWLCEGLTADREHPSPPAPHISEILVSENGIKMQDRRKQTHTSHIQVTSSHTRLRWYPLALFDMLQLRFHCTCGLVAARLKVALLLKLITAGSRWLTNGWPMVDPLGNHKDGVFGPCGGHTVTQSNIWAQCHPFRNQIHDKIRTQHTQNTQNTPTRAVPPAMARFPAQTWHPHGQSLANCKMLLWLSFKYVYIIFNYIQLYSIALKMHTKMADVFGTINMFNPAWESIAVSMLELSCHQVSWARTTHGLIKGNLRRDFWLTNELNWSTSH